MSEDDHLDKEMSVSAEMTPTGVHAKAKSRTISAVDRLFGNVVERLNLRLERGASRERANIEGQKRVIAATYDVAVERIKADPEFAERALLGHVDGILRKQENKDAVVQEALEDLRADPPTEADANAGEETLDPAFMDSIEFYAEGASTEELRQRWGRVLASEIRKPGTFSRKVLRVVDELDLETAKLFERLCLSRIQFALPLCLVGQLSLYETSQLVSAGLITDIDIYGQGRPLESVPDNKGKENWFFAASEVGFALPKSINVPTYGRNQPPPLIMIDETVAVAVYSLTREGVAISSILPGDENTAVEMLINRIRETYPEFALTEYRKQSGRWMPINGTKS